MAIFVPHNGCPHQCSFCNQKSITGQGYQPTANDVKSTIETALNSLQENSANAEIAFFGGSFTAIDNNYMLELLNATKEYINQFMGIRISTRPDCINKEILLLLKSYKVTSIELGAQSLDDSVLIANNRGHTKDDVINASKLIKEYGFSLGLQMMTGLYKSTVDSDIATAKGFIALKPDTVRIYPTVVMKNTALAEHYYNGSFVPYTLETSVNLCSKLLQMFEQSNINVIRVGLHHSDSLQTDMISDSYHPAFRELCESKILLNNVVEFLNTQKELSKSIIIYVSPASLSKMIGQKKANIKLLNDLGYNVKVIQDSTLNKSEFRIEQR